MRTSKSTKALRSMALITAAVAGVAGYESRAQGATITWVGGIVDPGSGAATLTANGASVSLTNSSGTVTLSNGQNQYNWATNVANWATAGSPVNFTVGDDTVFTDNFAGGTVIRVASANMNPTTMRFIHDSAAPSLDTTYIFLSGAYNNLGSNTPLGASHNTVITLDTGFTGSVLLLGRPPSSGAAPATAIVRSGLLQIGDGGALPNQGNNNVTSVTLDGGEFRVDVRPSNNTNPSSGQLAGALTVLSNSVISKGTVGATSRVWGDNGTVSLSPGVTLTAKSLDTMTINLNSTITGNGTILMADGGVGTATIMTVSAKAADPNTSFDLGTSAGTFAPAAGASLGALYHGVNSHLQAGGAVSIGAKNITTTYEGIVTGGSINKVGSAELILPNASTTNASLITTAGTLTVNGALGAFGSIGSVALNGGTLNIDNTTNNSNRLADGAVFNLAGGNLQFQGNLSGTPTAEVTGTLTVNSGSSNIKTIATGAGGPASITFKSLTRTGGVVNFAPDANVNIAFDAGSLPTVTNGLIGAWGTVNSNSWATLSGNNVAAYSHTGAETNSAPATWNGGTLNINLTAGGTSTVAAPTSINSLRLTTNENVAISGGSNLSLVSGGLLAAGTSNPSITGAGSLTAGTGAGSIDLLIQVPDAANTLTISAPIADNTAAGTVNVVKAGLGKLVLSGTNSFTGRLSVLGGTLGVAGSGALPSLGTLTVDLGTTFDLSGFNQSVGTTVLINGSIINSGGAASLSTTNVINVQNGTVSANLAGAASLSKNTGGVVTLSGTNTYTGGTVVTGGTLTAGAANIIPAGGTVSISSGATLNIGAFNQSGMSTVTLGNSNTSAGNIVGTGVLTSPFYDVQNGTITAVLGPTGDLSKSTAGNATLTAANTYTGVTTISGGVLNVTTLGNGSVASGIGQSGSAASNLVLAGGTLSYIGTPNVSTDRQFQLNSDSGLFNNSATGTLTIASTAGIAGGGGKIVLGGSNTGTNVFNMSIGGTNSGNGLTKTGGGRWVLGQSNTYTGDTTIAQGTLEIGAFNQNVSKIHVTGGGVYGTGIITTNQDIDMQGGTLGAVIAQTGGNIAMIKGAGFGTSIMNHTFTGRTEIGGSGTLMINAIANGGVASPIGASTSDASNLVFGGVGTLLYIGAGASTDRLFTLNGNGAIASSGTGSLNFTNTGAMAGGGSTLTLGGTFTGANTLAASIGGSGGLTKADAGQWILSNTGSTYTDRTTVSGGVLSIASIADLASPSSIGAPTDTDPHRLIVGGGGTLKYIGAGSSSNRAYTIGLDTAAAAAGNATFDSSGTGALQLTNTGTVSRGGGTGNIVLGLAGTNVGNNTLAGVIGDASISVTKSGAGKWILSANNSYGGTTTVTGGTLVFSTKIPNTPVSVTGGVLQVAAKGTPNSAPGTSVIKSFASTGGTLDLTNNSMVIDYSGPVGTQVSDLRGHLKAGRLSTSSGTTTTRLGYADNATLGKSTFGGISVDSDSILVKYTYAGDSDLDGDADGVDIGTWATNFTGELGGAGSAVWTQGDWDYDGDVDGVDAGLWAQAFTGELGGGGLGDIVVNDPTIAPGAAAILRGMGITVVPEPASLGLLALVAASSLWRPGSRKRRRA